MRIKTEIFQAIFIITCEGPSLNASLAQEFLAAMNIFLVKSELDIILDLSNVNFVDSTGLSSVVRSLKKIDGTGKLLLCGVDEHVFKLLRMTRMDKECIQLTSRKTALSHLFWERKKTRSAPRPHSSEPYGKDVQKVKNERVEKYHMQSMVWNVDEKDFEEIVNEAYEEAPPPIANKTKETKPDTVPKEERRKYRRIGHRQIMTDDFIIYCKNTTTGKHHPAVVLNISPGGLLMTSRARLAIGDEFLLEGRIGRAFKFKERAVSRASREQKYGLEFIDLSPETSQFLNRLTGSVDINKSNKLLHG